jgi:hypothetical protein
VTPEFELDPAANVSRVRVLTILCPFHCGDYVQVSRWSVTHYTHTAVICKGWTGALRAGVRRRALDRWVRIMLGRLL